MVSSAYQFGLLLVVFGGFLATNSAGEPAGWGIRAMILGLLIGILDIIQSSIPWGGGLGTTVGTRA